MAKIMYGTVEIPVDDPENVKFFREQVLEILGKGGGWLSLADPANGKAQSLLITPGVPLFVESEETSEELEAGASYVNSAEG